MQQIDINQLNNTFGIPGRIEFVGGEGGFVFLRVVNDQASAVISLYGAQVLSYVPGKQTVDMLFVGENAYYVDGKAIRGGIPLCWPWFNKRAGYPEHPGHGIARIGFWSVTNIQQIDHNTTQIHLSFNNTAYFAELWPYSNDLAMVITVSDSLELEIITTNTGNESFTITQAFHNYFRIGDIEKIAINGLSNVDYIDNLDQHRVKRQFEAVSIHDATERIYSSIDNRLSIDDFNLNRKITIDSTGTKSVVIWNPWTTISKTMPDLTDNDYRHFICVETGNVGANAVTIEPGQTQSMSCIYRCQ
jgi:glucose-6-phosphate 1-epimerase